MEFEDYCNICGIALFQKEVSGEVNGTFINYDEHRNGTIQLSFCPGCLAKIEDIMIGGMDKAVDRRLELFGNDSVDKTAIARAEKWEAREARLKSKGNKDKDEDGSGGVKPAIPPA